MRASTAGSETYTKARFDGNAPSDRLKALDRDVGLGTLLATGKGRVMALEERGAEGNGSATINAMVHTTSGTPRGNARLRARVKTKGEERSCEDIALQAIETPEPSLAGLAPDSNSSRSWSPDERAVPVSSRGRRRPAIMQLDQRHHQNTDGKIGAVITLTALPAVLFHVRRV